MARKRVDHTDAPIVGYTDRLSARPGDRLTVHASSTVEDVRVRVLRISHDGRSPVRTPVDVGAPNRIRVPHQSLDLGSYGLVRDHPQAHTFSAWVWPTAWPADRATVLSQGSLALSMRPDGRVEFAGLVSEHPLHLRRWYRLTATPGELTVQPRDPLGSEERLSRVVAAAPDPVPPSASPLVLGARLGPDGVATDHFDGKIDQPAAGGTRWDLARDIGGDRMVDATGDHHGRLHNGPLRGVTGHDWTGDVLDWRHAERGYGAVHFHADDLSDAGWAPAFSLELPRDLPSGCYAVELASAAGVDRLPFFVRPRADRPAARMALLVPTLSYLAYALEHCRAPFGPEDSTEVAARFARANTLHSLYDRHTDGSGVATASLRRPLLGMRDDHTFRYTRAIHQYSEDVALVGWLGRQGFEFDVLTDHDMDAEGVAALAGYRVVVTGSHPEYWTGAMLDAVADHLRGGGRVAYLGGNGAYWVTAIPAGQRHLVELRRGYSGVRTWESEPGELHLACTGEPGGLWAERGRSPHRLFGVGTTAAGMTAGAPFGIVAGSDVVFAGVDTDAPLGVSGDVLGAAASFETDGIDALLGSPPDVRLLGRAMLGEMYSSAYTGPAFPHPLSDPVDGRRADLTLLETAGGGVVFATGSIGWCGALSRPDVSRVTRNVLRWFVEPGLHPEAAAFLASAVAAPMVSPAELRESFAASWPAPADPVPVGRVYERAAGDLTVRVYEPHGDGPWPALVWFHGGGWVIGSLDENDATCRTLCRDAETVVVSVDYRLAPEHRFPAAVEDAYAAVRWVAEHGPLIGVDPRRIAVAGESAGANLAAVAALMARDRGGPRLALQILASPVTAPPDDRPSYQDYGAGYFLDRSNMEWYFRQYTDDPHDPYVSPLLAKDLSGLPPALVLVAECEPIRDEGEEYARRLSEAGVRTDLVRYPGQIHGFFALLVEQLSISNVAHRRAVAALRRAFTTEGAS